MGDGTSRETRRSIRSLASIFPTRPPPRDRPTVALVLAGGGARGAYEAGVLRYICDDLPRETGVEPWFDIVCGTSVGALNACFVAATADLLQRSTGLLAARWGELRPDVVSLRPREVMRFMWSMVGGGGAPEPDVPPKDKATPSDPPDSSALPAARRGGLLDTRALERFVLESVPWSRISENVASGVIRGLSVSATHVASGKTVVFVENDGPLPPWSRDPHVRARKTKIAPWHALASAAIPLLFPAMPIDGAYYVDGGLRQNTPLSPALRLGADRVLVVSLRYVPKKHDAVRESIVGAAREEALPSPFFLLGKTLNALLIDRIDYDLDRLRRTNRIIEAGRAAFGANFLDEINDRVGAGDGSPIRTVRDLLVRPSEDVGFLANAYAKSPAFAARATGITGRALRRLADMETTDDSDLLSYLLFDGGYGELLVELGRGDARARKDELAAFFAR